MCHPSDKKSKVQIINKEILDYSMRKAFLERAVIELVYRFDEKFIEKVNRLFNFFSVIYIHTYIYIWTPTPITKLLLTQACAGYEQNQDFLVFEHFPYIYPSYY